MLSYTVPAVTQAEATDYTSAAGVTPQPGPADLMRLWADRAVTAEKAKSMSEDELRDKIVYGRFVERGDRREYTEKYAEVIRTAQEG